MTRRHILGAVIAGGEAKRFGSDKAQALLAGLPLIEHVLARLGPQVDALVVCGRSHPAQRSLADVPAGGLGPLGGLCAALLHARAEGFDVVLSAACDTPDLPPDLARCLAGEGATFVADCPIIGWWPVGLADALRVRLESDAARSAYAWATACGARAVALPALANVNTPDELERLEAAWKPQPAAI